jgi:raffinose/stachyose/melibiose transport system permease protein
MRVTFLVGLAILGAFSLAPALGVVAISFTDIRGLPGIPIHWVGMSNYTELFSPAHRSDNINSLKNTLLFASVSTVLGILLAFGIAVLLNQKLRGRSLYRAVVFMPTVLGVTVIGFIWSLVFDPIGGPAARVLESFGHTSAFFGDPHVTLWLVIFVQIWATVGVTMVIFLAGLQAIPEELYEVASIDGANAWRRMRHVTLPMLAPALTANVLLGLVSSLQSYQLIYVLTGPLNRATQVLSLQMYLQAFGGAFGSSVSQSQGYAAAISMVQFVIVGVMAFLALAYLRRREARL